MSKRSVPFPIFSMNKRVRQPVTASPFELDQDSPKYSAPSTYGDFTKQLISTSSQRPYTGSHHKDQSSFLQQSYPGQNPRNYQNSQNHPNHPAQNQQNHPSLRSDVMRSVPQGSTPSYVSLQGNSSLSRPGSTQPVNSMKETLEDSFPSHKTTPTAAVKKQGTSSSRSSNKSLRLMTATAKGLLHWASQLRTIPILFEVFGVLNQPPVNDQSKCKSFSLTASDGILRCVYYEMDYPFPKSGLGSVLRCVGSWDSQESVLKCVSLRLSSPKEQLFGKKLVALSDKELRELTTCSAEH